MGKNTEIRNYIEDIKGRKVQKKDFLNLSELLEQSKDISLLFDYNFNNTASFNPNFKRINVNLDKVDEWADGMVDAASSIYEVEDLKLLKAYFIVQMYKHELEHAKQFLISSGIEECEYGFIKRMYKDVFDYLIVKDVKGPLFFFSSLRDIGRITLYKKNAYSYILERSADIESYDYVSSVAMESNDTQIKQVMISCRNASMLIGYEDNGAGCIKKTYEGLHMNSKYGKLYFPPSLSMIEKVRYGVELKEGERKKLMKAFKTTIHFK